MDIVVDASVILAVLGNRPEKAALVRLTKGATLLAPPSVQWEVGEALLEMVRRKAISLDVAIELVETYAAIPIRMSDVRLMQVVEWAAGVNVSAEDASVLACAVNHGASLLTLDDKLKERARDVNVEVLEVRGK
ncbi:MAG TPA: type II toxin-antitoxin system VapC family toxin [Terriglobales bacterium]|nr:type II toxin-antitoxin system VapC family toxin [Terriglobales bacterium]